MEETVKHRETEERSKTFQRNGVKHLKACLRGSVSLCDPVASVPSVIKGAYWIGRISPPGVSGCGGGTFFEASWKIVPNSSVAKARIPVNPQLIATAVA